MSVDSLSSVSSSRACTNHEKWRNQRRMSSGQSTESEGPAIVVNDMSSGSEKVSSNDEDSQKIRLMSLSEYDSIQSSGTEITSEGAESEAEKRPLTPSTSVALTNFLEEALSDEGLSQDLFLLKHVRRHRHGFVSLKLLAGYKQAKKIACDWQSLSLAARHSNLLEVNADGRKVRRVTPLPDVLLHVPPSRVVAAVNISDKFTSIEKLAETFGKFGNVTSLHLIKHKAGGNVPEALQPLIPRVPEVSYTNCALIQYDDVWGVARALKDFSSSQTSLHVLHNRRKSSRSSIPSRRNSNSTVIPPQHHPASFCSSKRKTHIPMEWRRRIAIENQRDSTGSEAEEIEYRRRMGIDGRKSRASCPNISLTNRFFPNTYSLPNSPRMGRKDKSSGIIRDPKGPDGTRGFRTLNCN